MCEKTRKKNLELFRSITGKTVIAAPIIKEPKLGYCSSRVEGYWK